MKKYILTFCVVLIFSTTAHSQQEASNSVFGHNITMSFKKDTILLSNNSLFLPVGATCISNDTGMLLFYSNNVSVWDRSHYLMQNGANLLSTSERTIASITVPYPGNKGLYLILTISPPLQLVSIIIS